MGVLVHACDSSKSSKGSTDPVSNKKKVLINIG